MKPRKIDTMLHQIDEIFNAALAQQEKYSSTLDTIHPKYLASAKNLLHYRAFRKLDVTDLQRRLGNLGLSRLAKAEAHLMASLLTNKAILKMMKGQKTDNGMANPELSIKKGRKRLRRNVESLLGKIPENRRTSIMVTLPSEAANQPQLIEGMIKAGMNCARINCAHDEPKVWEKMIHNVRQASKDLELPCKIAMDLAGPKIRTGQIEPGPEIVKIRPKRNLRGQVIEPARVAFGPENTVNAPVFIPITSPLALEAHQKLYIVDTRGKRRKLTVVICSDGCCLAEFKRTCYFETDMPLFGDPEMQAPLTRIGKLPALEGSIYLKSGDTLVLRREQIVARHRGPIASEILREHPHISCTNPDLFDMVQKGERIMFDDGKFEGTIESCSSKEISISIHQVRSGGARLKADKGINFPDSKLQIRGLTEKDVEDLKFVVQHADIVNMSFVNTPQDVFDLLDALKDLNSLNKLGVILKIETVLGYENLTKIILAGMRTFPIGIMIARGDLALEMGWDRIGIAQRDILEHCNAAHIPDIWATQVFETLAKSGVPSRAEITDATMAQRAECVMLNKGPYILNAITLLDKILSILDAYQDKSAPMHPAFQ